MKFELKHTMDIDDEELLEHVNLYLDSIMKEDDEDYYYKSLKHVPENLLLDVLNNAGYLDTELENVLIEELTITKV